MPQYHNNILAITMDEWLSSGLSYSLYKSDKKRGYLRTINRAGYANGVLIEFDSLRQDRRDVIEAKLGDVRKLASRSLLEDYIKPDTKAAEFFSTYRLPDGRTLSPKHQLKYMSEAILLNALHSYTNSVISKRKSIGVGKRGIYDMAASLLADVNKDRFPNDLPTNPRRLMDKLKKYQVNGYESLVHGNWGNSNSRKVNEMVERLLISIYCMDNLPFGEWVHDYYLQFISGALQILDIETGELFNRNEFRDKNGNYIILSVATIWNVLNRPDNQTLIDRLRNNRIDHITTKTPHNFRYKPQYSLSKISMDDRTLPRKTTAGEWVNLYYSFDVASGCVIGVAIGTDKPNLAMVRDCLIDMYRNITANGLKWPAEVECENHLMRDIEDSLRRLFGFVTFTTPNVSRGKRAEHGIKAKKYGDEKRYQVGIGRWNAKGKAFKTKSPNKDEDYKQPRLPLDELIAEEYESIERFNHTLHPDQVRYKGKTRWQVLVENLYPGLLDPKAEVIAREIGSKTETSLRNNDYVRVQYENYAVEDYSILSKLKPNNFNLEAYYIPVDGLIKEVYLYQGDTYLGKANKVERYQEAKVERTDHDEQVRMEQSKRQAIYHSMEKKLKAQKFKKVKIIEETQEKLEAYDSIVPVVIDMNNTIEETDWEKLASTKEEDIVTRALNNL